MTKVAQGWVINWWPPARFAAAAPMSALDRLELPLVAPSSGQQQQQQLVYSVELKEKAAEKSSSNWQALGTSRERSILLKDLKPGTEYSFRIFAHAQPQQQQQAWNMNAAAAANRVNAAQFKYLIPDNRRKPGSTQALSAGVVSGVLFFIACIVIAVCAVNMCNKRRKKRAEKG